MRLGVKISVIKLWVPGVVYGEMFTNGYKTLGTKCNIQSNVYKLL